jgi:hypothetical protein
VAHPQILQLSNQMLEITHPSTSAPSSSEITNVSVKVLNQYDQYDNNIFSIFKSLNNVSLMF